MPGRTMHGQLPADTDVLLVRSITKVDRALLEKTAIKFVGTATIGTDHIDRQYLADHGIAFTLYALKGSSGKTVLIEGSPEQVSMLAYRYGSYRVEPFANDVGDICPQAFIDQLQIMIERQLRYKSRSIKDKIKRKKKEQMGPFFTGPLNKTLIIKGRVIQYDISDIIDRAASPLDEAICRVKIIDADTGNILAEGNCTGRAKSSVRTGAKELADGVAKAVKKMLKPRKQKNHGQE